jgi:hypothetical protein
VVEVENSAEIECGKERTAGGDHPDPHEFNSWVNQIAG